MSCACAQSPSMSMSALDGPSSLCLLSARPHCCSAVGLWPRWSLPTAAAGRWEAVPTPPHVVDMLEDRICRAEERLAALEACVEDHQCGRPTVDGFKESRSLMQV